MFLFDSLVTLRQVTQSLGYKDSNKLDSEDEALKDGVLIIHAHNKDMPAQKAFWRIQTKRLRSMTQSWHLLA